MVGDGAELNKLSNLTIRHDVVFLENFPLWKFPWSELEEKSNLETVMVSFSLRIFHNNILFAPEYEPEKLKDELGKDFNVDFSRIFL